MRCLDKRAAGGRRRSSFPVYAMSTRAPGSNRRRVTIHLYKCAQVLPRRDRDRIPFPSHVARTGFPHDAASGRYSPLSFISCITAPAILNASTPAGTPQYIMACRIASEISSSVRPLLMAPRTCALSSGPRFKAMRMPMLIKER